MNSAPYLLNEDRPIYERVLDEALRTASERPDLATEGRRFDKEQLRTMALNATSLVVAAAMPEYLHYVQVRREHHDAAIPREPSEVSSASPNSVAERRVRTGLGRRLGAAVLGGGGPGRHLPDGGVAPQRWARMSYGRRLLAAVLGLHVSPRVPEPEPEPVAVGARTSHTPRQVSAAYSLAMCREVRSEENTEQAGAGWAAVAVVFAVLSGGLAALFLLVGSLLRFLKPIPSYADTLVTAGWALGALNATSILFSAVCLLVMALRKESTSDEDEVAVRAREVWEAALLERGILPFLRDALADPAYDGPRLYEQGKSAGRIPQLGYSRPSFSSPDDDTTTPGPRPRFSSPDFSSPDYDGPEHRSE